MNTTTSKPDTQQSPRDVRDAEIGAAMLRGEPALTIAKRYNLSGERVRQIGLPYFKGENPNQQYREAREDYVAAAKRDLHEKALAAVTTIAKSNPDDTVAAIARKVGHGVTPEEVGSALGASETARREGARFESGSGRSYTDEECMESLRRVSRKIGKGGEPGVVTMEAYDEAVGDGPKSITIQHRFGAWIEACERAGVPSGAVLSGRVYKRRWSDEEIKGFVQRFFRETGFVENPVGRGSMQNYTDWAEAQSDDVPKVATLRVHFGSWSAVKQIGREMISAGE